MEKYLQIRKFLFPLTNRLFMDFTVDRNSVVLSLHVMSGSTEPSVYVLFSVSTVVVCLYCCRCEYPFVRCPMYG